MFKEALEVLPTRSKDTREIKLRDWHWVAYLSKNIGYSKVRPNYIIVTKDCKTFLSVKIR